MNEQRRSRAPSGEPTESVASHAELACPVAELSDFDLWQCNYFCRGNVQRCWHEWNAELGTCQLRWDCHTTADILAEAGIPGGPNRPLWDDGTMGPTLSPPGGRTVLCDMWMRGIDRAEQCWVSAETRSERRVDLINPRDFRDHMDVVGEHSNREVELLHTAWGILVDNLDLVDWAYCLVFGPDANVGSAIRNHIVPPDWTTRVRVDFNDNAWDFFSTPGRAGGVIRIGRANSRWVDYVDKWRSGVAAHRRCAALDLSATLLHELIHTVWRGLDDWMGVLDDADDSDAARVLLDLIERATGSELPDLEFPVDPAETCYRPYLLENIYRWALFRRHPWASDSWCCRSGLSGSGAPYNMDDAVFAYNGVVYPIMGCAS